MTIITADGKTIQFAGDDSIIVDRRVTERRAVDHVAPERRENDRRVAPVVVPVAPRPLYRNARVTSHVTGRDLNSRLDSFLDTLLAAATKKSLTDAEAVAALSTEATLMFAESKPCWNKGEERCFQATASS